MHINCCHKISFSVLNCAIYYITVVSLIHILSLKTVLNTKFEWKYLVSLKYSIKLSTKFTATIEPIHIKLYTYGPINSPVKPWGRCSLKRNEKGAGNVRVASVAFRHGVLRKLWVKWYKILRFQGFLTLDLVKKYRTKGGCAPQNHPLDPPL